MERIIYIQMYPEQRFIRHRIQVTIELLIIFILQFAGLQCPQRITVIDDVIFVCFNLFSIFPVFLFTKSNRYGKKTTIFLQQRRDAGFFQEFFAFIVNVKYYICTTVSFIYVLNGELRTTIATPFHCLSTFFMGFRDYFHFLSHHES